MRILSSRFFAGPILSARAPARRAHAFEPLEPRTLLAASLLDPAFGGGDGISTTDFRGGPDSAADVAVLPGDKVLAAGTAARLATDGSVRPGSSDFAIARYRADGTLDPAFGTAGKVTTDFLALDDVATAMAVLPDGRFVVAGSATRRSAAGIAETNLAVARYLADGTLDRTFDGDGKVITDVAGDDFARDVAVLPDGDVLVVGTAEADDGESSEIVAVRYNADGTRDRSFGGGDGIVTAHFGDADVSTGNALALLPGGDFVVAGEADDNFALARFNADGSPDTGFGGKGHITDSAGRFATAIAVLTEGDLLVAGETTYSYYYSDSTRVVVRRYDASGVLDDSFNVNLYADPSEAGAPPELAVLPGGKFLLTQPGAQRLSRHNSDGSRDTTFGDEGSIAIGPVTPAALAIDSRGRPVIAGRAGGDFAVARLKAGETAVDNDDQVSEAVRVSIGSSKSGRIDPGTDVDLYKFTVSANQRLAFDVDVPAGSALDPLLRVFSSGGEELAAIDDAAAPGEPPGYEAFLRYFFPESGTYYVGVSASPNANYDALRGTDDLSGPAGAYVLRVDNVPAPVDGDDQLAEAVTLSREAVRSAQIEHDLDVDAYRFTAAAGDRLAIDLDLTADSGLSALLRVFDAAGQPVSATPRDNAPGEAGAVNESYVEHTFPDAGTYYVLVSDRANAQYDPLTGAGDVPGGVGPYRLVLSRIAPDPDDQIREAALLTDGGSGASGRIDVVWDVDMYRFNAAARRPVALDLDVPSGLPWGSMLRVFDAEGAVVPLRTESSAPDETSGTESYLEFLPAVSGTYYVGVSSAANSQYDPLTGENDYRESGPKGLYVLRLAELPTDPDDQLDEAAGMTVGSTRRGSIDRPTDVDMYRVVAAAGQTLGFDIDRPSGSALDSYLIVLAENTSWHSDDDAAPGESLGLDSYIEVFFETAGTYYVGISGADKDDARGGNRSYDPATGTYDRPGSTGDYALTVTNVTPPPDPDDQIAEAVALVPGVTFHGELTARDVDMFRFSARAGERREIASNEDSVDLWFRLFGADGTELFSTDYDSDLRNLVIPADGTYYLGVSSYDNQSYDPLTGAGDVAGSMGSYSLTLRPFASARDLDDQISEARALPDGVRTTGTLNPGSDVDMFRITAAPGDEFQFDVEWSNAGVFLRLFDADGEHLANNAGPLRHVFESGGAYYLGLSIDGNGEYDALAGTGDLDTGVTATYALTAHRLPADGDDQLNEARALTIGGSRSGTIGTRFDVDVYVVQVSAGTRLGFDLDSAAGSDLDSHLRLFDASGEQLGEDDDAAAPGEAPGPDSYIEYLFTRAGTYYIAVSGSPNTGYDVNTGRNDTPGSTGGYTLRAARASTG